MFYNVGVDKVVDLLREKNHGVNIMVGIEGATPIIICYNKNPQELRQPEGFSISGHRITRRKAGKGCAHEEYKIIRKNN